MKLKCANIRLLFFILAVIATVSVAAQGVASFRGRVLSYDGKPLAGAHVAAVSLQPVKGAVCDMNGHFKLELPADSSIRIEVSYLGYTTKDTVLCQNGGTTTAITFRLKESARQLGPVQIIEERSRTTTFTAIDVERLERYVGPQSGVESLLKTLPDVSSNNEMSSQYSVRGGSFDENLVYINHVEVYRPLLVRNGQQEGTSMINPDMVDHILFSPGGFDATYGDRMASVLDLVYSNPPAYSDSTSGFIHDVKGKVSASFLGASLSLKGLAGKKFSYSLGLRQHSNRYLFGSLDTKGNYTTSYSDMQSLLSYKVNEALDLHLLMMVSRNIYGLIPESQTTTFGGFNEAMQFEVYYEGEESDSYTTTLAALSADYHPNDDFKLRWTCSFQGNRENESYDILSQYMLYELNVGNYDENGETERFDRGIGSFLEHARNNLKTNIFAAEVQGTNYAALGNWNWGLKLQHEQFRDRMKEWKLVDSSGFALPTVLPLPGNDSNMPLTPILQLYCRANHAVSSSRLTAFVQRNVDFYNDRGDLFSFVAGVRAHWYDVYFGGDTLSGNVSNYALTATANNDADHNSHLFISPRLSFNYKPQWRRNILFRLAAGIYSQAPLYREFRYDNGELNHNALPQRSYQAMGTMDWNFHIGNSPFKFTADVYYKYISDLIAYRIDNLRIRYDAENNAVGYAAGLSLRLSGEVVEGLESWASLSLMKTQQNIDGDDFDWIARPADQRISFKLFFQDYVPSVPFWRMSLSLIAGSGMSFTYPTQRDFSQSHYYPAYFRVDWGNTLQLSHFPKLRDSWLMRYVDDVLLSVEVFNLFDYKNVVAYTWVSDYANQYYPVPNYLTARQLNFKITVTF